MGHLVMFSFWTWAWLLSLYGFRKENVESITVVEKNEDVINLFKKYNKVPDMVFTYWIEKLILCYL